MRWCYYAERVYLSMIYVTEIGTMRYDPFTE